MKKKIMSCCAAVIAAAMLLAGCGNNEEPKETVDPRVQEIADEYFPQTTADYKTWTDIDRNKLVAYVDGIEDKEFFDIPFGEFFSEYMYYLISYQIDDDMSETYKATCEGYRDNIITYLAIERMYLYVADKEYGITESTLTEQQLDEIRTNAEAVKDDWASNFYAAVSEKLGEDVSEEEKDALCSEVLRQILSRCGLGEDIFYKWEMSRYIQDILIGKISDNAAPVSDEDVQEMLDEFTDEAKDKAENAPEEYESLAIYSMVYVPEGTRVADQIFVAFSDEDLTKIAEAINSGDEAEADRLVEAAYTDDLKATVGDISDRLAAGEDFGDLKAEFDVSGSGEMIVLQNSPSFFEGYRSALYALENKGDVSEPVVYSSGIYFIKYADDAQVQEADIEEVKASMRSYLESNAETNAQNDIYNDWIKRFPYTIDYETLQIDGENSVLSSIDQ